MRAGWPHGLVLARVPVLIFGDEYLAYFLASFTPVQVGFVPLLLFLTLGFFVSHC
jgi:hypothetical protein